MFFWLVVASAVTGIGVIFEAPAELRELTRWWKLKQAKKKVGWRVPITFFGLVLVIGGIIGEGVFEWLSSDAETDIRAYDENMLETADFTLGQVLIEASFRPIPDPAWLTNHLRKFKGKQVILRSNAGDIESWLLCTELKKSIDAAGLSLTDECWKAPDIKPFMGLEISGPNEPETFAFEQTFVQAGIPGGITGSFNSPAHSPFVVLVSYKAPSNFVQYPKPNSTESTSSTALSR